MALALELVLTGVEATGVDALGALLEGAGGGGEPAFAGAVVGIVFGMLAVAQLAVVGYAVVATAGEVVP